MKKEIVKGDVLCVGGGIAGLMAAIRASEFGAKVIVAEKANTLRSGSGATGNDHFLCYIPEIHGSDITTFIKAMGEIQLREQLAVVGKDVIQTVVEKSFDIVKLWESWGIPMRYKGKWEFAGHAFPGRPRLYLKYNGQDQKKVITKEAIKKGIQIINRVMVFELLGNKDSVIGALGMDTREDKLIVFNSKSVILGTGRMGRLYPGLTPGWMFNSPEAGTLTGDGRAMAYRIGAELINVEMIRSHAGPKYFARFGQATWIGVLRDPHGKPIGPFLTKPDKRYGDITTEVDKNIFLHYAKSGTGPVYMDCSGISDEDYEYMMHWLRQEGNIAFVNHLEEEGIDVRKNPVEFMSYPMPRAGRIWQNAKGETSVKGLYVAGDESISGISQAAVSGWIAGENAAKYSKEVSLPTIERTKAKIKEKKDLINQIRSREIGPNWKEVNIALQQIMMDYAGTVRSETLLEAGLSYLLRLKKKACSTMKAVNQHEMARCLEVLNLLDLGELIFITAIERKETRGPHVRTDCPFTNPLLNNKLLFIKKVDEKPLTGWKEVK